MLAHLMRAFVLTTTASFCPPPARLRNVQNTTAIDLSSVTLQYWLAPPVRGRGRADPNKACCLPSVQRLPPVIPACLRPLLCPTVLPPLSTRPPRYRSTLAAPVPLLPAGGRRPHVC